MTINQANWGKLNDSLYKSYNVQIIKVDAEVVTVLHMKTNVKMLLYKSGHLKIESKINMPSVIDVGNRLLASKQIPAMFELLYQQNTITENTNETEI